MGSNHHSSYTTASKFHTDDMNPPLSDLDSAITLFGNQAQLGGGAVAWDSTTGTLSWTLPMRFLVIAPSDRKMRINLMASGSIAIPAATASTVANVLFVTRSTVHEATVSATYVVTSTASTVLNPAAVCILGAVDTALSFYPHNLTAAL